MSHRVRPVLGYFLAPLPAVSLLFIYDWGVDDCTRFCHTAQRPLCTQASGSGTMVPGDSGSLPPLLTNRLPQTFFSGCSPSSSPPLPLPQTFKTKECKTTVLYLPPLRTGPEAQPRDAGLFSSWGKQFRSLQSWGHIPSRAHRFPIPSCQPWL
ncbi:hypothetical protein AAY473_033096 [Plecturocebus cupreus]